MKSLNFSTEAFNKANKPSFQPAHFRIMRFFLAITLILNWGLVNGQNHFFGSWQQSHNGAQWDRVTTTFEDWVKNDEYYVGEGLRLVDFEHYNVDGQDYFFGSWQPGSGAQWDRVTTTFEDWVKNDEYYVGQELRLVDFEHYNVNGQDYFFGSWQQSHNGAQWDRVTTTFEDWVKNDEYYVGQGLRLVDFEHYNVNGQDYFFGSWQQSNNGTQWDRVTPTFEGWVKNDEYYVGQGLRLVDFEHYNINGQDYFFGSWQTGSGTQWDRVTPTFEGWVKNDEYYVGEGLRLRDFEHYYIPD